MEAEAALQPPSVRLNTNTRKYTIQQLKLAPSHPINREFSNMPRRPNPKATVQLERIGASIQDLVNQEDLESLQHFNFPPWNKDTLYSIDISPLPKDEAALVYNTNLYLGTNKFTIYTDASSIPGEDSKGVGVGCRPSSTELQQRHP